jgi:hypothetical protein
MSGKPMTVAEKIRKNIAARSQEKQTVKEVPKTKEIPKASPTIKPPIHKSQSKSKFPFDKVSIESIVEVHIPEKYPDGSDVESILNHFNVSKSQYRKENGTIKIMDQMVYHKFMNDYHEAMSSPPQSSKPTTSPHESKSEPMVKKEPSKPSLSFTQRKKMKEVNEFEYYDEFKEAMKEQYINNGEKCKKYEFPYKIDNFDEEYDFFLEWKESKMQELLEAEEGDGDGDGEEGGEEGEEGEEGEDGEDGPDEPNVQEGEEGQEEFDQNKLLQEIIEQDDDELSESFNEDTLKIPGLKESFLEQIKETSGVDEFNEIQENGLCDSTRCENFREYCKENM